MLAFLNLDLMLLACLAFAVKKLLQLVFWIALECVVIEKITLSKSMNGVKLTFSYLRISYSDEF